MKPPCLAILILLLLSMLFSFCTAQNDRVLYRATCLNEPITLLAVDPGALQNHYLYTRLIVGNRPAIRPKDRFLPEQMPYDTAINGTSPWKLIDTTLSYSRKNKFHMPRDRVMLYLDPKVYSEQDFAFICDCLRVHAHALVQAMDLPALGQDYQFAGIVLGNSANFTQRFSKGPMAYVDILPNGSIEFTTNRSPDSLSIFAFKEDKVWMPGRQIIIDRPHRSVTMNLHDYPNPVGKALDEVFSVVYK